MPWGGSILLASESTRNLDALVVLGPASLAIKPEAMPSIPKTTSDNSVGLSSAAGSNNSPEEGGPIPEPVKTPSTGSILCRVTNAL